MVSREELSHELDELNGAQKTVDIQLAQLCIISNKTVQALNTFMAYTNKTLQLTQGSQIMMEKRLKKLEELARQYQKSQQSKA